MADLPTLSAFLATALMAALLVIAAGMAQRRKRLAEIEQRRQVEALHAYHSLLLESIHDAVVAFDRNFVIRAWNAAASRMFGYSAAEVIGKKTADLSPIDHAGDTVEGFRRKLVASGEAGVEAQVVRKDGRAARVLGRMAALRDGPGGLTGFVGVFRDITRRTRAEERLELALEGTGDGLWDLDPRTGRLWVSQAWAGALGLAGEEVEAAAEPVHGLFFPDEPRARQAIADHVAGQSARYEYELRVPLNGAARWVRLRGKVVERRADGEPDRLAGSLSDVTDQRTLQGQLQATDRMASMGTLAAGMAHEVNTPLACVASNLAYAIETLGPPLGAGSAVDPAAAAEVMAALSEAAEGADRVRRIVIDMKAFSRSDGAESGLVDVRDSIRSALSFARSALHNRAQVEVELGEVPLVEAPEHRVSQVFLNLLVNAAQAIQPGEAGRNWVRVRSSVDAEGRAVVEVADSGCGISPEARKRLFEPFFTTKPVGVGTGLGLSICRGVVESLGGIIEVESGPGRGSTFRVRLPSSRLQPERARQAPVAAGPVRRGRILVVDPEALVGAALRRVLAPPHLVEHEATGLGALARFICGERFDVVLCDAGLPDLGCGGLRDALAERLPVPPRFGLLEAGPLDPATSALLATGLLRIEKPFQPPAVRAAVAQLLEQPASIPAGPLPARAEMPVHHPEAP